jgi:uncharacterized membrane protein YbhN (UPF0104 family)
MKQFKRIAGILVLVGTLAVFANYLHGHPELWWQLQNLKPSLLVLLFFLYACTIGVLVLVYDTTLRLCKRTISIKEHTQLTFYSTIVNFFGPLQSGPGFRSVYLKRKHNVSLQRYATITLIYYGFYAVISGLFVLSGEPKFLAGAVILGILLLTGGYLYVKRRWPRAVKRLQTPQNYRLFIRLGLATLLQVIIFSIIYFSELRAVSPHVHYGQALIYTGAANFALFVSLTPGALGFRESFLLFSRHLHHIDAQHIIAANVIDRSVYVAFLGLLFLASLAIHAKAKLGIKPEDLKQG